MAKGNIQTVNLSGYKATVDGALYLVLGTWDSYGIEQLQINAGPEWEGLVIKAVFVTPAGATAVIVPDNGLINVPPEATAQALTVGKPGAIVFSGVTSGVQRISCNLPYLVRDHVPIDGTAPEPTPDEWAQLVTEYQNRLDKAVPPDGEPGQVLTATDNGNAWTYPSGGGGGSGGSYIIGEGLKYDPDSNILSVDTADKVEQDNTLPVTSAAVYTTVGNIDALLGTI